MKINRNGGNVEDVMWKVTTAKTDDKRRDTGKPQ
jgi:hypothetical protein